MFWIQIHFILSVARKYFIFYNRFWSGKIPFYFRFFPDKKNMSVLSPGYKKLLLQATRSDLHSGSCHKPSVLFLSCFHEFRLGSSRPFLRIEFFRDLLLPQLLLLYYFFQHLLLRYIFIKEKKYGRKKYY